MKHATLSLVLPVYNSMADLAAIVQDCLLILPQYFADYEIIVVDDSSQDGTLGVAQQLAAAHDPVMVLRHPHMRGYASSLINGLRVARGDYILALSPDSRVSIGELARMIPYLEQHDIVMSYRSQRHPPWRQRLIENLLHRLINNLLGLNVRDVGCRFSLLRADAVNYRELLTSGMLAHVELYARACRRRLACIQVGVYEYAHDDEARRKRYAEPDFSTIHEIVKLWRHLRRVPPAPASGPVPTLAAGEASVQSQAFWQQKLLWGLGLAVAARSVWMLVRRRGF